MEIDPSPEPRPPPDSTSPYPAMRACTNRLLASPEFRIPVRRARLLRYLVDRTATGEGEQINEYAIAVDVFERPPSFDPKTDAVVRAEVSRLRRNLKEYYARGGDAEGAILELPTRSYVPVLRSILPAGETAAAQSVPRSERWPWIWILAGIPCALAALVLLVLTTRKTPDPPANSLALLPAAVTPAARDFQENADAFSEELLAAIWNTPGLSALDWPSVSGYRGPGALSKARAHLPVALILETGIDRQNGQLVASFHMYDRATAKVVWSAMWPLGDVGRLRESADALAKVCLSPVLAREFNFLAYRSVTGRTRMEPPFGGLVTPRNPCAASPSRYAGLGRSMAQVDIGAVALNPHSKDARIQILANGQRADPMATINARAGIPILVRAPSLVQLSQDTCIATASSGDIPVYEGNCIVPPPGASQVRLLYSCAPKAMPIDIAKFANDHGFWNEEMFPAGPRILDGVPFLIPDGTERAWHAGEGTPDARPIALAISVRRPAVSQAFFLLNTLWGQPGPESYITLEFAGDRGAHFEKKLIGGVDVRDYNHGVYTNTINGTTTRLAFDNGHGQRMDVIQVDLPPDFHQQTLETITIRDTGGFNIQRTTLWAVSVR